MILVTGGNGRFGNVLVKEFNKRGQITPYSVKTLNSNSNRSH